MQKSPIEWTQFTSNPIVWETADGERMWFCTKVSPGCTSCYAERMNLGRFGAGIEFTKPNERHVTPRVNEKELAAWIRRKKPATIFVGDMTDLFHEKVGDAMLDRLFAAMAACPQHTFQVLTKRAERMQKYMSRSGNPMRAFPVPGRNDSNFVVQWPLPNVWPGVSAEDQERADERIPILLATPAAKRFVSAEPMLEPIYLNFFDHWSAERRINLVIVGCESGSNRRPCELDWIRDVLAQSRQAGIPAFVKQIEVDGKLVKKIEEFPEDLRVREWPDDG